jgi:hypothetical protein
MTSTSRDASDKWTTGNINGNKLFLAEILLSSISTSLDIQLQTLAVKKFLRRYISFSDFI